MEIKPIKIEKFKSVFEVSRENLETLVQHSRIIKARKQLKSFYDDDFHALERLQFQNYFLILGLKEFEKDNYINFNGVKISNNPYPGIVELIIKDLEHKTSIRFAYAAYLLMIQNRERYPRFLISKDNNNKPIFTHPDTSIIGSYFKERLRDYFKHGRK
ncbi:MAG: hypothetical protein AABX55_01640 [Nanoarchaeota archaeon]